MTHLQLRNDGDYCYRSGTTGEVIQIELQYWKDTRNRGIYAMISPITLTEHGFSTMLFSGKSVFLRTLPRKSPKILAAVAAQVDPIIPELVTLFLADKHSVVARLQAVTA